ncbi:nucleotidyltransferase family protein [Devosia sp. CN2-171]|uniref:nucleotidyltransferase family protein n=1 Tax=Devosia sp. CN2-171 TaxID=3400909 RepID=UPI003BF89CE8
MRRPHLNDEGLCGGCAGSRPFKRTGSVNKLANSWQGRPLLDHLLRTIAEADFADCIVVTGAAYRSDIFGLLARAPHAREAFNQDADQGMGTSIAVGIAAIAGAPLGAFICLGDMPLVTTSDFGNLAAALTREVTVVRPTYNGLPGHPVLFGRRHFGQLARLEGDTGASSIIANLPEGLCWR